MAEEDGIKLPSLKTELPCLICGRASAGKHYGVQSCVRCKTFFRRAVLQNQTPSCLLANKENAKCDEGKLHNGRASGSIPITQQCRGCRFARCLKFGMSVMALKPKRDIISVRRRFLTSHEELAKPIDNAAKERSVMARISNRTCNDKQQASTSSLQMILELTSYDQFLRDKKFECLRYKSRAKRLASALKGEWSSTAPTLLVTQHDDMSSSVQIDLSSMLDWAKSIPQFTSLPVEDQLLLIRRFAIYYLILEHGYFTARMGVDDAWAISNGSIMPRDCDLLPEETKRTITEARKWRQKKLWREMTSRCIDEVALPLRHLQLTPEEILALKIILLFHCGNHAHEEDKALPISDSSRRVLIESKDEIIRALFEFYRTSGRRNCEERLGNVLLTLSGIFSAGTALLESFQIMRLFALMSFDAISEQLLFGG